MVSHHRASCTVDFITTALSVIVALQTKTRESFAKRTITNDETANHFDLADLKGGGGRLFGLLSGLRRPPDLGYFYRRIFPQKVAFTTTKSELFYSSSQCELFWLSLRRFGNFLAEISEIHALTDRFQVAVISSPIAA